MTRWAVSHVYWFEHDLRTEIVSAEDWKGALVQHSKIGGEHGYDLSDMPDTLEAAKQWFFDLDSMIEVVPIADPPA